MTMQTTTPAPDTGIIGFPLDQLYLSEMNPRQETDVDGIALLADSIAVCGLVQNLAGLMDSEGRVAIVAGGRRLRALACAFERDPDLLQKRPELAAIPVRLAPDEATARAWASAENAARRDLHPADEIRAYGRMREAGAEVPIIARTFGTTEAQVYRRLALADLPAPVLDALKAGEITLGIAAAFTVTNDETLALHVLEQVRGNDWFSEHRVKRLLQPDAVSLSDRRATFFSGWKPMRPQAARSPVICSRIARSCKTVPCSTGCLPKSCKGRLMRCWPRAGNGPRLWRIPMFLMR